MENQNVPIEMWNTNKRRRRTNSALEGWNCKLNSIRRKQRTIVFLKIHKVAQWLRCCATNRKVAGSIPAGVIGFFIDIKSF